MDINEIRNALTSGVPIEYKAHCQKRMLERGISRNEIINCILHGEIIEDYPLDENNTSESSFPSCLILWIDITEDNVLHVVIGYNGRKIIIISAYHPQKELWSDDYKKRRTKHV